MSGFLGVGVGLLVIGLIGLVFLPWGGAILAVIGIVLIGLFLAGLGKRSIHPHP
jgi:hypothetical protein